MPLNATIVVQIARPPAEVSNPLKFTAFNQIVTYRFLPTLCLLIRLTLKHEFAMIPWIGRGSIFHEFSTIIRAVAQLG